jgi:hypothetical protein
MAGLLQQSPGLTAILGNDDLVLRRKHLAHQPPEQTIVFCD